MSENATNQQTTQGASQDTAGDPTAIKDPADWVTGGEPATGAQLSYLHTLATEAKRDVPEGITKAQASELIDELASASKRVTSSDS